jgi:hypothetical protein
MQNVQKVEGVQKGHFTLFFRKITFDYKRVINEESLEKRLFGHPPIFYHKIQLSESLRCADCDFRTEKRYITNEQSSVFQNDLG